MSDDGALINIGELSRPAKVLIEKISDAIGGIFRPYQIRRIAQAEAEAEKIRTISQVELSQLQYRAISRFFAEEAKKQANMESITEKAISQLEEGAKPEDVEEDWLANFFDKCRLITDDQMQLLWARILSGEANSPGRYSKRTVSLLGSLDKNDAELFRALCSFGWQIGNLVPLIYDVQDRIYTERGLTFAALQRLDEIGLVSFGVLTGYRLMKLPRDVIVSYYGERVLLRFQNQDGNEINLGHVLLSKTGQELAPICGSTKCAGFKEYVTAKWSSMGYVAQALPPEGA
jgi:hypothetical protein